MTDTFAAHLLTVEYLLVENVSAHSNDVKRKNLSTTFFQRLSFSRHSRVTEVFVRCSSAHAHVGSKHISFRVQCTNDDMRTHFLRSFLRTVTVIRARAPLSVLVRFCAVFSQTQRRLAVVPTFWSYCFFFTHTHFFTDRGPPKPQSECGIGK